MGALKIDLVVPLDKGGATVSGNYTILTVDTNPPLDCADGAQISGPLTLTPLAQSHDEDGDGCTDWEELGSNQILGGLRDPFNPWDYADMPSSVNTTTTASVSASATPPFYVSVGSVGFPGNTFFIDNEKFAFDSTVSSPPQFHVTARALDGTVAAQHNSGAYVVSAYRNQIIRIPDIQSVQARYGQSGNANADPFGPPPPSPNYYSSYDRSPTTSGPIGPNAWNLAPANGLILTGDITSVVNSYGHDCVAAP